MEKRVNDLLKDIKSNKDGTLSEGQMRDINTIVNEQDKGMFASKMNRHLCKLSINTEVMDVKDVKKNGVKILEEIKRIQNEK